MAVARIVSKIYGLALQLRGVHLPVYRISNIIKHYMYITERHYCWSF